MSNQFGPAKSVPAQSGPAYGRAIAPHQGGRPIAEVACGFGLDEAKIIKLASNENPLGMPESAKQAMLAAMAAHWHRLAGGNLAFLTVLKEVLA